MDDNVILKELGDMTKDRQSWKANIDYIANKLNNNYSNAVKAKALWLLGEIGLRHPEEIEGYVGDIAGYMDNDQN